METKKNKTAECREAKEEMDRKEEYGVNSYTTLGNKSHGFTAAGNLPVWGLISESP